MHNFSKDVIKWFNKHGRTHLPWQQKPSPYSVWVSEIMLQQTQVATVIPYYERFMKRFPTVEDLAGASIDEVLHHWAGLGYYARGRNLHRAAQQVVKHHQGHFPNTVEALIELPGIGRSTAGAIVSLGHHERATILDGNVKRVLARVTLLNIWPDDPKTLKKLWTLAESLTPTISVQAYNQAMMDLGAMVCTRTQPHCGVCPLIQHCQAYQQQRTHEFPVSKPKKAVPHKTGQMVILVRADGAVLLRKRASPGIWGGLWCFPEREDLPPIHALESRELGVSRHAFTHYKWDVQLEYWKVDCIDPAARNDDDIWYTPESQPLGLAAIVKRFLPLIWEEKS